MQKTILFPKNIIIAIILFDKKSLKIKRKN